MLERFVIPKNVDFQRPTDLCTGVVLCSRCLEADIAAIECFELNAVRGLCVLWMLPEVCRGASP